MRALILAALFLATPAFAQDAGRLELAAKLLGGMADGASVSFGAGGAGTVTRSGDTYEIRYDEGAPDVVTMVTFAEPEPCVFTRTDSTPGEPVVTTSVDFNRAQAVELLDSGALDGLNNVIVQLTGGTAVVQRAVGDAALSGVNPLIGLVTSVPLNELLAARDGLVDACPGPTE